MCVYQIFILAESALHGSLNLPLLLTLFDRIALIVLLFASCDRYSNLGELSVHHHRCCHHRHPLVVQVIHDFTKLIFVQQKLSVAEGLVIRIAVEGVP